MSTGYDTISAGFKRCSKGVDCIHPEGPILPATKGYFQGDKRRPDGLYPQCKICYNTNKRKTWHGDKLEQHLQELEYREALKQQGLKRCARGENCKHPEGPILPATLEYFGIKKHPDQLRSDCRECIRQNTKERNRLYQRKRLKNDPEHRQRRLEYHRQYRKTPRGQRAAKASFHRYNARKNNLPDTFTLEQWERAISYFNDCCAACERPFYDLFGERFLAMDHWIPISSPDCPGTVATNMVPLCHGVDGCNNTKNQWPADEWLVSRFGKRKAKQILARIEAYFEWVKERD